MKYTHWSAHFDGKNWSAPVRIKGINPTLSATTPEIIFDGNGNVVAAWLDFPDVQQPPFNSVSADRSIFTSRFDVRNLEWDNPIQLTYDNSQEKYNLKITSRNNGRIHVLWEYLNDDYSTNLWSSVFNGSSWSNPTQTEAGALHSLRDLTFSIYNNDMLGYSYYVTYEPDVMIGISANHFNGNNWNTLQPLSTDTTYIAVRPQTIFDNSGNSIMVWTDVKTDGSAQIVASHFNRSNRSWSAPITISGSSGAADNARIAVNNNGNAIVVWANNKSGEGILWANHFDGSNWGTPLPIESIPNNNYSNKTQKVVFDDNNHAHVVWVKTVDGNSNVWANHFDGNSWGTASAIENTQKEVNIRGSLKREWESGPLNLDVAIDGNGNAHALWERSASTWERESNVTVPESTKTKTLWTSQLKPTPVIGIRQAIVYTPFGGLVVLDGARFIELGNAFNEVDYNIIDQDGNSPLVIYAWRYDLIVALFRDIPDSVTMTNLYGTKVIPLIKYY
jgi:hypothetical protein